MYKCMYMYVYTCSTEGVCYRIKQRLQAYNMEPVSSQVVEFIGSSKVELHVYTFDRHMYLHVHVHAYIVHGRIHARACYVA